MLNTTNNIKSTKKENTERNITNKKEKERKQQ